jgi:drug/metabolite transporter (DMT)-like permease
LTAPAIISRRQLVALVVLSLMWGVNWPVMKLALRELPPLHFRAITMTLGAAWLFVFYHLRGVRMVPTAAEWRTTAWLALPNMLGWHTLSILGVQELASGRAAILGFTMPIWTVLIGIVFLGERLTQRVAFATVAVAIAIGLLISHEFTNLSGRPLGIVWMELAAMSWAVGTLMMRRFTITLPMEAVTVWMMALTSVCLWIIATTLETWPFTADRISSLSTPMWLALVYSVAINYGFAQIIWFGMARHLPPTTSAMSVMAIPLIGTLSATVITGEWPHWQDYVAVLFVMAAIAAVLLAPRKSPAP